MPLTVLDFSDVYFVVLQKGSVPPVRQGKFIVMTGGGGRYAAFSPRELSVYHANVLERLLLRHGIRGQYNMKGDVYDYDAPGWTVEGGGLWRLDGRQGTLEISGRSASYGGVDLEELAGELHRAGAFGGVEVVVVR